MLLSLALIVLIGLLVDILSKKLNIPSLLMLIGIGIVLGPSGFNGLDASLLTIAPDLRQIILIIILTRAGLALNLKDLKKVGRPAILLSFIPAIFEVMGTMIFAPIFLGLSLVESALLGSILGAVSPAVIVPRMLQLIKENYGKEKGIPQLLLASSSIDDIFGLILFASFLSLVQSGKFEFSSLAEIPITILSGLIAGLLIGYLLAYLFAKSNCSSIYQVLLMLGVSFGLVGVENHLTHLPFSGILAVMGMAIIIYRELPLESEKIAVIYKKLWVFGEIFLFVLVGASVNIKFAFSSGVAPIFVVGGALVARMIGVGLSLIKTNLNFKEKIFCMLGYSPKATVQAAIGAIPLTLGLPAGNIILTVSVLAILITAPLGAWGMDLSYKKLLEKE